MVVACCAPMWPIHRSGRGLPPALGDQQLLTPSSLPPQYASPPDAFERSTHASSLTGSRLGCVHKFRLGGALLRVKRLPRYGVTRGLGVAHLQRRQRRFSIASHEASTSAARVVRRTTPLCLVELRRTSGPSADIGNSAEPTTPKRQRARPSLAIPLSVFAGRAGESAWTILLLTPTRTWGSSFHSNGSMEK
jgi:hypothetical protein